MACRYDFSRTQRGGSTTEVVPTGRAQVIPENYPYRNYNSLEAE